MCKEEERMCKGEEDMCMTPGTEAGGGESVAADIDCDATGEDESETVGQAAESAAGGVTGVGAAGSAGSVCAGGDDVIWWRESRAWWEERLDWCEKPSARQARERLNMDYPCGVDTNLKVFLTHTHTHTHAQTHTHTHSRGWLVLKGVSSNSYSTPRLCTRAR
jgi:hypothetical protein